VEVTAQIVKWNAETRTLSGLFRILGYAVAGIQDQFSILGAVVTGIGIALVNSVLYPIEKTIEGLSWLVEHAHVLPGLGGMADVDFSPLKRLSEDLGGIREEITAKGWDFIGGIADRFQRGESAVMRFHKSLSETKKTLEDMAAGEAKAEGPLPTITPKGAGEGTKTKESAEEKAIKKAIAALREKAATLGYTSRQEALYKLMLKGATDAQLEEADALLASIEKFNLAEEIRKGQIEANNRAIDQAREEAEAIRDILDPLREIERQIARIWELSRGGFLSPEEAQARIEQIRAEWKVATDDMTKLGMGFAQSFQQALGEFLYDPFKDGVKGMLSSFVDMIRKMVAEALAAQIMQKLLGSYGQTGQMGGWVGMLMSAFSSRHSGGLVHEGGPQRRVSPTVFIGAPRLHAGGMLGLKPGEVPIVAKRGEEVLTRDDPRHAANGGGPGGGAGGVRILNVIDPDLVHDYLQSSSGEKVLLNVIQKNAGNIKQVLA